KNPTNNQCSYFNCHWNHDQRFCFLNGCTVYFRINGRWILNTLYSYRPSSYCSQYNCDGNYLSNNTRYYEASSTINPFLNIKYYTNYTTPLAQTFVRGVFKEQNKPFINQCHYKVLENYLTA